MDTGDKVVIGIGVLGLLMFLGMSVMIYDIRLRLDSQEDLIDSYNENARTFYSDAVGEIHNLGDELAAVNTGLEKHQERISILDESIDSKDKRWATIKRVRDAIESTTSNPPPIIELTKIASAVVDYSDQYDVPTNLVLGMMRRESNFKAKAKSHAGALGLMQVMPETGKEISADVGKRRYHLYNIRDNIHFGTYYIRKMLDRFDGNVELAVRAYNCGPTYTEKVVGGEYKNYPEETIHYLEAVLKHKEEYENLGL
jgi:hypothetical protein